MVEKSLSSQLGESSELDQVDLAELSGWLDSISWPDHRWVRTCGCGYRHKLANIARASKQDCGHAEMDTSKWA